MFFDLFTIFLREWIDFCFTPPDDTQIILKESNISFQKTEPGAKTMSAKIPQGFRIRKILTPGFCFKFSLNSP